MRFVKMWKMGVFFVKKSGKWGYFKDFLNVANEEKFTILGGKLFQTCTTRSLKSFPRVRAAVVNR